MEAIESTQKNGMLKRRTPNRAVKKAKVLELVAIPKSIKLAEVEKALIVFLVCPDEDEAKDEVRAELIAVCKAGAAVLKRVESKMPHCEDNDEHYGEDHYKILRFDWSR